MKILFSTLFFLLSIISIASAEVLDVNIKGVDNGITTSRQQDYREAVMNAKLQAIEQAGSSIESITKVLNFELKYDAVESKSKALFDLILFDKNFLSLDFFDFFDKNFLSLEESIGFDFLIFV